MSELRLNTDGHIIKFGADNDVSLTHVADTGLLLNSTMQLQFNDASQNINAPSATVLDINATDEIELNATLVDINANVEISGTATTTGVHTFSAAPVFPDGSIAVADLDIDGATDIGAAVVDADLFIIDDGAGGTNRKVTASRLKTYAGGAATIGALTDVTMDATNFVDSILIQTNSDGSAPTTGTLSSASNNVGIGKDVFAALTSGNENSVIGTAAGQSLTTGVGNVFMGLSAGTGVTTGGYNIFIGRGAGDGHDAESNNIGIGKDALGGPLDGAQYNTAVGTHAVGVSMTTGDWNSGFGANTLEAVTTGKGNVHVGANSGASCTTGDYNICLGYSANVAAAEQDHGITIGHNITAAANDFSFGKGSNVVTNDFDADANWSRSSDVRKKQKIYNQELGLDFINDLRTVRFQWKPSNEFPKEWNDYSEENNMDTDVIMHGFIAQEVKSALDKHASDNDKKFSGWKEGDDGMQHTSREMFVIPLIKAVQELTARVKELEAK